jgi:hypothetical protein
MISCYVDNHPGRAYQSWWQDILNSQPQVPGETPSIPLEETPPRFRPPASPIPQPPDAPKEDWQPDYRSGSGPGYGAGAEAYYQGGSENSPAYALPNLVTIFDDPKKFGSSRMSNTILKNDGALKDDATPRYETYNPDDNGGISVGIRRWKAGGEGVQSTLLDTGKAFRVLLAAYTLVHFFALVAVCLADGLTPLSRVTSRADGKETA